MVALLTLFKIIPVVPNSSLSSTRITDLLYIASFQNPWEIRIWPGSMTGCFPILIFECVFMAHIFKGFHAKAEKNIPFFDFGVFWSRELKSLVFVELITQ